MGSEEGRRETIFLHLEPHDDLPTVQVDARLKAGWRAWLAKPGRTKPHDPANRKGNLSYPKGPKARRARSALLAWSLVEARSR